MHVIVNNERRKPRNKRAELEINEESPHEEFKVGIELTIVQCAQSDAQKIRGGGEMPQASFKIQPQGRKSIDNLPQFKPIKQKFYNSIIDCRKII